MNHTDNTAATSGDRVIDQLHTVAELTRIARDHGAYKAAEKLAGARRSRAVELVDKLTDVIDHAERLAIVVKGDLRSQREATR